MRTNKERQQLIYRRTLELRCKERRKKQCMFSVCVVLEVVLYVSSNFIHDYTRFNLYFLIDFVLTIVNMLLLPCTVWEVSRDDVY